MSAGPQAVMDALVQSGPATAAPLYQTAIRERAAVERAAANAAADVEAVADSGVVGLDFAEDCAAYYQARYGDSGFAERWSELAQFMHIATDKKSSNS